MLWTNGLGLIEIIVGNSVHEVSSLQLVDSRLASYQARCIIITVSPGQIRARSAWKLTVSRSINKREIIDNPEHMGKGLPASSWNYSMRETCEPSI